MIQLEEGLLAQATKLASERGCDLSQLIEEALRDSIARTLPNSPRPFVHLTTVGGEGMRPGVDLNNTAALLSVMEQGE